MKQYQAAKARYPRHLLFFRIGDFFELFYDDAKTISRVLGLTLTSRNKGSGDEIPFCGVPFHSAAPYVARLIEAGHIRPVVERVFPFEETKLALEYVETGRTKGKVVIKMR